ncbi:NUDIX domain-containing protein [Streptomyces koyangensis]|uniref:NUDIX hydrolase n=1 Tax=Streptomyces koyangensis TaxID=188770 RepID=UPI003665B868
MTPDEHPTDPRPAPGRLRRRPRPRGTPPRGEQQAAPDIFYLPGGKPDPGETAEEALHRELAEELGITLRHHRFLAEIHATAALEGVPMRMRVYEVDTSDTPRPAAELAALRWTDGRDPDLRLAPAVSGQVVPLLRERGLLS